MLQKTKILILGGGFGGLYTALELEKRTGVAKILGFKFSGFMASWLWRTIYLSKLPMLEKKLRVTLDWTLDVVFSKDLVQFMPLRSPGVQGARPNATERESPKTRASSIALSVH